VVRGCSREGVNYESGKVGVSYLVSKIDLVLVRNTELQKDASGVVQCLFNGFGQGHQLRWLFRVDTGYVRGFLGKDRKAKVYMRQIAFSP
jgi:hypothetical protein